MIEKSWQDQDILAYLGKEAPRYTSYPSAHHFGEITGETFSGWLKNITSDQSLSLYVHIPFCAQMCYFCGCNTQITKRYEPVAAYIEALIHEIDLVGDLLPFVPKVHALHFGGGSPSMVNSKELKRLFSQLRQRFAFSPKAEISIELDPRGITQEKVKTYRTLGFNRVSLGVQDTQDNVQLAINRVQPLNLIVSSLELLRTNGLTSIGLDLVYGLPQQTLESLQQTLGDIIALDPDRISTFSYAHVPWVKKHQSLIDSESLATTEQKAEMFIEIDKTLMGKAMMP